MSVNDHNVKWFNLKISCHMPNEHRDIPTMMNHVDSILHSFNLSCDDDDVDDSNQESIELNRIHVNSNRIWIKFISLETFGPKVVRQATTFFSQEFYFVVFFMYFSLNF